MAQSLPSDAVVVKSIKLSKLDGSKPAIDISTQVVEFNVYEDIKFPVIRAEFIVIDANDIATTFPIIGEEMIEVEFLTPGFEDISANYKLQVKSIESSTTQAQGKSKSYVIYAMSPEFFTNATQYISGKQKGQTNEIVSTICKKYLKTKKDVIVNADPTKGTQDVLISRLRPLQAIDLHRTRAVSKKYESSSYVFFENKRGFNFCTVEYLLDNQKKNINDKIFFYDTANKSDIRNMTYRNILNLKNISLVDNTTKMTSGSLNMSVKRFDLLTGKTEVSNYINREQQHKFKFSSEKPKPINSESFEQKYGKTSAVSLLVPHSSEFPENYISGSLGAKHSYVNKLDQNLFYIYVNGDTALTAGDVITINVPTPIGGTEKPKNDRLLEGNYLVSKLRHIIVNLSPTEKSYTIAMELIKGSYEDVI